MQRFTELYQALDETTKTSRKLAALTEYFQNAAPEDAIWAIYFLNGSKLSRVIKTSHLRAWACEAARVSDWMFDECYEIVGDLAETIALLLPAGEVGYQKPLHELVEEVIKPLKSDTEYVQKQVLLELWSQMTSPQRFLLNKLLTGAFRVGVSAKLVTRGLAEAHGLSPKIVAHRLMGEWKPTVAFYESIISKDGGEGELSRPYPFCLAHPLQADPASIGSPSEWHAEWKWDGIRTQIIKRNDKVFLWSRGEELINPQFPELAKACEVLTNGTVLDGEVLIWKGNSPSPFADLQQRLNRKTVSARLQKALPVRFIAFDQIENEYEDLRAVPFVERRKILEQTLKSLGKSGTSKVAQPSLTLFPELEEDDDDHQILQVAKSIDFSSWEELAEIRQTSREHGVEGVMLKQVQSTYEVGRVTGSWWKWKIEPYTIDAVMIYAQRGSGRRASLYSDYTFAVWDNGELVPFAKAYSGLTDEEMRRVDRFVREHTVAKFGPVRHVEPTLVFELAFENVQLSNRHKSGIAVRFPRMARWRTDKTPDQADTLDSVRRMISSTTETQT